MSYYPKTDVIPRKPFVSRKWFKIDDPVNPAPRDGTPIYGWVYPIAEIPAVCWFERAPKHWDLPEKYRCMWRHTMKEEFETEEAWKEDWLNSFSDPTHWLPIDDSPEE